MPNVKAVWPSDPAYLHAAFSVLGLSEIEGARHEKKVLAMYAASGHPEIHDDETPWCAAYIGWCLLEGGLKGTGSLLARSYTKYGTPLDRSGMIPRGAIAVWTRDGGGHVNFVLADDGTYVTCIGGNQSNNQGGGVTISRRLKDEAIAFRMPIGGARPEAVPLPKPKPRPADDSDGGALVPDVDGPAPPVLPNPPLADDERVPFLKRWWRRITGWGAGGAGGVGFLAYATDWRVILAILGSIILLLILFVLLMGPTNVRNFIRRQIKRGG